MKHTKLLAILLVLFTGCTSVRNPSMERILNALNETDSAANSNKSKNTKAGAKSKSSSSKSSVTWTISDFMGEISREQIDNYLSCYEETLNLLQAGKVKEASQMIYQAGPLIPIKKSKNWTQADQSKWDSLHTRYTLMLAFGGNVSGEFEQASLRADNEYAEELRRDKRTAPAPIAKVEKYSDGFVKVSGVTIKGDEKWIPKSDIFVEGRNIVIPDLIVCDHEVTLTEWKEIMGSVDLPPDYQTGGDYAHDKNGKKIKWSDPLALECPVEAAWEEAVDYCNKRSKKEGLTPCYSVRGVKCNFNANGYRLPTEAEWEYLARGGENYKYPGSDNFDEVGYALIPGEWDSYGFIVVKSKKPNGYGLYDMAGNVAEWCWAPADPTSGNRLEMIKADTPAIITTYSSNRIVRGGDTNGGGEVNGGPGGHKIGFRVVRTANGR